MMDMCRSSRHRQEFGGSYVSAPLRRASRLAFLALFVAAQPALAHTGNGAAGDLWSLWDWDPLVLIGLALGGGLYALGVARVWSRAGVGRGIHSWQVAAFAGGLLVLAVALLSPVAGLGEELFAAHMVQHLLLLLVAPPLLLLGEPRVAVGMVLPRLWRRPLAIAPRRALGYPAWHPLTALALIWVVQMTVLWGWHHPRLYEGALRSAPLHALEHLSFVVTALLFWDIAIRPFVARGARYWTAILFVVATALPNALLGALMTLAPEPWYATYTTRVAVWGLTPLQDQQIAGLLMWIPPGLIYVVVVAALLLVWLDRGEARRERRAAAAPAVGEVGA
jgi:cytochrome c oxidase assembly factor CtaG